MSESALLLRPESPAPCWQGGELQGPLVSNSDSVISSAQADKGCFQKPKTWTHAIEKHIRGRDVQSRHNKNPLYPLITFFVMATEGMHSGFRESEFTVEHPEMCQIFSCEHSRTLLWLMQQMQNLNIHSGVSRVSLVKKESPSSTRVWLLKLTWLFKRGSGVNFMWPPPSFTTTTTT